MAPVNSFENYYMSWTPAVDRSKGKLADQLVAQLEADVRSGRLLPGTKLPPYRELADFLDVNVSTVTRAFRICREKGLISGSVGSATYVAYDAQSNVYLKPMADSRVTVPLGPLYPAAKADGQLRQILESMLMEENMDVWMNYGPSDGTDAQKFAALRVLERAGCHASIDRLLPATGGQNAISAILGGVFSHGDRIGVDPLIYPGFKTAAQMFGIHLIPIRQENGEMSEGGLLYAIRNEGIKGLYVMPDVQNPTTHIMTREGRRMIAETAVREGLTVIEDAASSLTLSDPPGSIFDLAPENTLYIGSMAKAIAPGLRLAYIAAAPKYRQALADALYNINLMPSPFMLELATRMLASHLSDELLVSNRDHAVHRNRIFDREMAGFDCRGTDECLFRWIVLPEGTDCRRLEELALEQGVELFAASRFAVGKTQPPAAFRVSVTSPKADEDLIKGLNVIKAILLQG